MLFSRNSKRTNFMALLAALLLLVAFAPAFGQTTGFTYQGRLTDGGTVANGVYDMQFKLYDALTNGSLQGSPNTVTNPTVQVTNGIFTVQLDFGPSGFPGADRFLEIGVRLNGSVNPYTVLSPRQPITSTPYAVRSAKASSADSLSSSCNPCVSDGQISDLARSKVTGSIPVTALPPSSSNYIQNIVFGKQAASFNIDGSGSASLLDAKIVNAETEYDLGGQPFASSPGSFNTFVGSFTGLNGHRNSFFGDSAGAKTTDSDNAFFGYKAGSNNITGVHNTMIGTGANVGADNLTNATAIGDEAFVEQDNSLVLGSIKGINGAAGDTSVGIGTTTPRTSLDVVSPNTQIRFGSSTIDNGGFLISTASSQSILSGGAKWNGTNWIAKATSASLVGNDSGVITFYTNSGLTAGSTFTPSAQMAITSSGTVLLSNLGTASNNITLCRNNLNEIANCSSSLRYKQDVARFAGGMDIVNRLRPISFTWKQGGMRDIGLGAEEVEQVEPLLTFRNDRGEIEGVKYNQLSAVFINAIKEQQAQIKQQQEENSRLKARLDRLERSIGRLQRSGRKQHTRKR